MITNRGFLMEKAGILVFFVLGFIVIGAANCQRESLGTIAGALVGLFFGCAFTGLMPKWMIDVIAPASRNNQ